MNLGGSKSNSSSSSRNSNKKNKDYKSSSSSSDSNFDERRQKLINEINILQEELRTLEEKPN